MDFLNGKTVQDLWSERVALSGNECFLIAEENNDTRRVFSYTEFNELIDQTARSFHDKIEIEKGDTVAIHLPNCPEYLQVWFALLKLGAISVHSNTNHTPQEINYTLDNSNARVVVTALDYADLMKEACDGTGVETIIYTRTDEAGDDFNGETLSSLVEDFPADVPDVDLSADDEAQIIFTSGTTNDPKGVLHTHTNLVYAGERASKHIALSPEDRMLTALPMFHVNAQSISALSTVTVGATLVLIEEFKASEYIDQLRRHSATITSIIGTQARAMLAQPERETDGDNNLREILFAINVTDEEKERFEERFNVTLLNGYGLSETMTIVTVTPIYGDQRWPSIGRPTFDREVFIVDENGKPVPDGERGEIAVGGIRGRNIMNGYYQLPEETENAFTEHGWLLTGDFGRFDEDGYLYFVDRKKNIIKTRGENVSEAEVESVLESHPKVTEGAVIGVPDEFYGEAVMAVIKPAVGNLTEDELRKYAEETLAYFKIPNRYKFVDKFPRTSIGKIEKSTLRDIEGMTEDLNG